MNQKGRYSGGRNHQKFPFSNRGAGGAPKPPQPWETNVGVCATNFNRNCPKYDLLSITLNLASYPPAFLNQCEKNNFPPKSTEKQKNTKIVRMTSYSHGVLSKKSAAQKYWVSIFRTNEGDFGGTPVKNQ